MMRVIVGAFVGLLLCSLISPTIHKVHIKSMVVAEKTHVAQTTTTSASKTPAPIQPKSEKTSAPVVNSVPVISGPSTTVPKPQVTGITYASGCSTYDYVFRQYAWNVSVAEAICHAESGGNPYAVSATDDYGMMQIHDGLALYGSQIYNPSFNIQQAYGKYTRQGWEAWTTYNDGAYWRFLGL